MPKVSEAHNEARRAQILTAGSACFSEYGFRATQMREVAERAGLSTGALYRYYPSKEDLFKAVIEWARPGEDGFRQRVLGEGEGISAMDRIARLPELMTTRPVTTEANLRRNFRDYGEAADIPFLAAGLADAVRWATEDIEVLVRAAQEDGDLNPELDPVQTASAIGLLWIAVGFGRLFDPRVDLEPLQRVLNAMVDGLRPQ